MKNCCSFKANVIFSRLSCSVNSKGQGYGFLKLCGMMLDFYLLGFIFSDSPQGFSSMD